MANVNKIVKYGLEEEVLALRNRNPPLSYREIVDYIKATHPDIPELQNLSIMSVKRFLESQERQKVADAIDRGEDVTSKLYKEFREKMQDLVLQIEQLQRITEPLIEEALENKDVRTLLRLLKEQRENIEQIRKNMVSIMNYQENKFKPIMQVQEMRVVNIRNILLDFSKHLCPHCRKKVIELIEEEAE